MESTYNKRGSLWWVKRESAKSFSPILYPFCCAGLGCSPSATVFTPISPGNCNLRNISYKCRQPWAGPSLFKSARHLETLWRLETLCHWSNALFVVVKTFWVLVLFFFSVFFLDIVFLLSTASGWSFWNHHLLFWLMLISPISGWIEAEKVQLYIATLPGGSWYVNLIARHMSCLRVQPTGLALHRTTNIRIGCGCILNNSALSRTSFILWQYSVGNPQYRTRAVGSNYRSGLLSRQSHAASRTQGSSAQRRRCFVLHHAAVGSEGVTRWVLISSSDWHCRFLFSFHAIKKKTHTHTL